MGFGLLLFLLFSVLLVLGAVWLVRAVFPGAASQPGASPRADSSTRQVLDQRYARGEISKDEYDRIRKDLEV
ncbi:MAG TPA: SHOCT domain-containing protein [Anaerolineales bacterium]|nr:SHOCT domain-containing protein [Anaerolineales bacterium]